jgi:thiamine biosynthesis lipoprotein
MIKSNFSEKRSFRSLGTEIYVEVISESDREEELKKARRDIGEIENLYRAKEDIFSRFKKTSEISLINQTIGKFQKCSSDISRVAGRALFYNKMSGGIYDPRVIGILEKIGYQEDFRKNNFSRMEIPEIFDRIEKKLNEDLRTEGNEVLFGRRMDFSGIAKGYITDCAASFLKKKGWKNFLVDSGGDIYASGKNADGEWRIEIEGVPKEKLMLGISNQGVATSGISRKKWQIKGRKFHHLVNPKNPSKFSYELRTVTVVEKNTENADGRAKVLVLLGKKNGMAFAKKNKIAAIFLDYRGNIFISPEAKKYLTK